MIHIVAVLAAQADLMGEQGNDITQKWLVKAANQIAEQTTALAQSAAEVERLRDTMERARDGFILLANLAKCPHTLADGKRVSLKRVVEAEATAAIAIINAALGAQP